MKKYLPSKQFIILFGSVILVGVVVFFLFRIFGSKTEITQDVKMLATRSLVENLDSDNDGLSDWEEPLWALDPSNPDTDGDGVLDKQEVEIRRKDIKSQLGSIEGLSEPKTETEKLARQLLTVALNIQQQAGVDVNPQDLQEVAAGFAEVLNPEVVNLYAYQDLRVSSTKTPQEYFNDMHAILGNVDFRKDEELVIFERAISTNRKNNLAELEDLVALYASVPEKIKKVEVPQDIAQTHLDYMNALTQMAVSLFSLAQYFEDPIISVRGIQEYSIAEDNLLRSSENLTNYINKNGIVR